MILYRGCRKLKKMRIIPAFLVLCVIFAIVPRPGAAAAGMSGLEVVGQTAMTQQTFTDISVIGANSSGLIDAINGTKNPAQTIGEWMKGEWDNWLLRQQLTWGTVLNIAAAGARYTGNGNLLFNSQLSDLFTRFYNWLWDGEGGPNIKDNSPSIGSDGGYVDMEKVDTSKLYNPNYTYNVTFGNSVKVTTGSYEWTAQAVDGSSIVLSLSERPNGKYGVVIFAKESGQRIKYDGRATNGSYPSSGYETITSTVTAKDGTVYYFKEWHDDYNVIGGSTLSVKSGNSIVWDSRVIADVAYLIFGSGAAIGDDQILGDPDKLGGLTGADTNVLAPPDIINWPDFGGNSGYIDVNDYITGLRGAIESQDGTADVNITDSEGIESTQSMEIEQTTDIPVENETTAEIVNQGQVISTATPSTELSEYTIDLRNYFPFCIPWDLYDMITLLVAEPVAPHVQYPFVIEPLNVNYTIDLDFSQFDSVAAVLRTMELLAAGIGLALMTKRLIQGGD